MPHNDTVTNFTAVLRDGDSMNGFTASNGITVFVREGGTVQFQHGTREESCGILQVMPHSEWWQALREFFRAEEDERLGRWRWPDNPDYVVYSGFDDSDRDAARVLHEPSLGKVIVARGEVARRRGVWDEEVTNPHWHAARAYFDAHPEPKPWHDARLGDLWILDAAEFSGPHTVEQSDRYSGGLGFRHAFTGVRGPGRTAPIIKNADRVWPKGDR